MTRSGPRLLCFSLVTAAAAFIGSCTTDSIPTTPSPPFLFTDLRVVSGFSPSAGTVLTQGQQYTAVFGVSYTLAPDADANRASLGIFPGVISYDANNTEIGIDTLLGTPPALTFTSSVVNESLTFTVPSGAAYVELGAYVGVLATRSIVRVEIRPAWQVQ